MARKKQTGKKRNEAETRQLVGLALLFAAGGTAVSVGALAGRSQVSGFLGGVLLVVAVLGAFFAAMWIAGAAMFVFFDQLMKDPERAVNWSWRLLWVVALASIPVTGFLLEFDRDQWIWGTGSVVAGLVIAVIVLYRPRNQT